MEREREMATDEETERKREGAGGRRLRERGKGGTKSEREGGRREGGRD